jgi:hypothetical protein
MTVIDGPGRSFTQFGGASKCSRIRATAGGIGRRFRID